MEKAKYKKHVREIIKQVDHIWNAHKMKAPAFLRRGMGWKDMDTIEKHEAEGAVVVVFAQSYYYRPGTSTMNAWTAFGDKVIRAIHEVDKDARLVMTGDHWAPFCGGASCFTAKDSFLWAAVVFPQGGAA